MDRREKAAKKRMPEGLILRNGTPFFRCRGCDNLAEWHGETSDFVDGASENMCGGSPRCIP